MFAQATCDAPAAANCNGATSRLILNNDQNFQTIDFTFDRFSQYLSGVTYYGATELKLDIKKNDTTNVNPCVWGLKMYVSNGGFPVPNSEWETLASYGASGSSPVLSLIQVRVSNSCQTSPINNTWQNFAATDGDSFTIIDDFLGAQVAGGLFGCSGGVTNTEGNYLQNPGEYRFRIDYRIVPLYTYTPGKYELNLKFCLVEL
jgi:hypothetical protein